MAALELTSREEFEHAIREGLSLVSFGAPWCKPCRIQEPIIDRLTDAYRGQAIVAQLNIDQNPIIAMELEIQSIPTIIIFREGCEVDRFIGFQSVERLDRALQIVLVKKVVPDQTKSSA